MHAAAGSADASVDAKSRWFRPAWLATQAVLLTAWGGLTAAAARSAAWIGPLPGQAFCGPWGCTAPTEDVVAVHATLLAIVLPPAVWAAVATPRGVAWRVAAVLTTLGAVLTGGLFTRGVLAANELAETPTPGLLEKHSYLWAEVGAFHVVGETTVPAVEMLVAGVFAAGVYVLRLAWPHRDGVCSEDLGGA
ncbi:MAG: hypothetical protein AAF532_08000 [Planctomycetota bacterium]